MTDTEASRAILLKTIRTRVRQKHRLAANQELAHNPSLGKTARLQTRRRHSEVADRELLALLTKFEEEVMTGRLDEAAFSALIGLDA